MHMDNKFGKISRISACAALKDGKTILEELSLTAVPPPESWQVILRIFFTM